MHSRSTLSIAMIFFLLNIALYQAMPMFNERLEESFQKEADMRDEGISTTNNENNIDEDVDSKIEFRSIGKRLCIWTGKVCID